MGNECIGCGCTDHNACIVNGEACHWLKVDEVMGIGVCSCCESHLEALEEMQAELAEFAAEVDR